MRRMLKRIAISAIALSIAATGLSQVADGDAQWALRAEGHQGGRARAPHIDAAIAAYQRAIVQNPNDIDARWKLLRAYRFKGSYVAANTNEKKAVFDAGKRAGSDALAVMDRQLAARGLKSISKATERQVADTARSIPGAAEVYFWDAVNWGEWALVYGKLAAVREGAADRIKRESTIAMMIDPRIEGGGPARVLGRLHDQTPKVPFLTGWVSKRDAVRLLNESLRVDPTNKITRVFLAEAMVDNDSDTAPQAVQILREVISSPNNMEFEVEQAAAVDDARTLLRKWGA